MLVLLTLVCSFVVSHTAVQSPRYFEVNGKTRALISSGEHYGALINLNFNYSVYFAALARDDFTMTIAFSGSYVEPDSDCDPTGKFPADNPLSPANGSYIAPWLRTAVPGGNKGGNKFDLKQYDSRYFERLRAFVSEAKKNGVVVQVDPLFLMSCFTCLC
jgi:hypothetical protein